METESDPQLLTGVGGVVRLEGKDVYPARIAGGTADAFSSPKFVLVKRRWLSDNEAHTCNVCEAKFTQIRRRHHCRQCGKIVCGNCCKEKIPLPQLGIDVAERVCSSCFAVANLVSKSRSPQVQSRIETAQILAEYSEDPQMISKVVELGGVQTLIALSNVENKRIQNEVLKGLQALSMHQPLHDYLTASGLVKAISHILEKSDDKNQDLLINGINSLYLICKSPSLVTKVLHDGALTSVLKLCEMEDRIALVAMQTLNLMVEDEQTHSIIVDNHRVQALPSILKLCTRKEPQMQLVSLKILNHISTSSDWNRQRIIQEDYTSGQNLKNIFKKSDDDDDDDDKNNNDKDNSQEILFHAVCLVANLATSMNDQTALMTFQGIFCSLLSENHSDRITCHVMRGIANFSKSKHNAPVLMQVFPDVIQRGLMCENEEIKKQAVRATSFFLAHSPDVTIEHLMKNGVAEYLRLLSPIPQFVDCLENIFSQYCSQLSSPK